MKSHWPGFFIVLEGIDGCGKGTIINKISESLIGLLGRDAVEITREPGGTALGEAIRDLMFKDFPAKDLPSGVVDLMFLASHIQNWETKIRPALDLGKVVVCDRWWYSQFAYGMERVVPSSIMAAYHECRGKDADLVIFLGADPETALARANGRTTQTHQALKPWNSAEIQEKVQANYLNLYGHRIFFKVVDTFERSLDEVWWDVEKIVMDKLIEQGRVNT